MVAPVVVECDQFAGPLDLLLDEVRRQNVAIEKLSLAPIVARVLEYVRAAAERNLNLDIEWLYMAATLIQWKSRSLVVPAEGGGRVAADPIRDEIVEQLLAHRKEAAEELGRRRAVEQAQVSRAAESGVGVVTENEEERPFLSVWDLVQEARDIARWVTEHRLRLRQWADSLGVEGEEATVSEMIEVIRGELAMLGGGKLDGLRLLREQATAARRSCLFLGMLEMAQKQEVEIEQGELFGAISVVAQRNGIGGGV